MANMNPHLYLDPDQQDLLLAALASNSSPLFLPESAQQQLQHYAQTSRGRLDYGGASKTSQSLQSGTSAPVESQNKMDFSRPSSDVDPPNNLSDLGVSPTVDDLDYPFDFDENYNWDQGLDDEYGVDDSIDTPTTTITEHEKRKSPPTDYDDSSTPSSESRQNEPKRRGLIHIAIIMNKGIH